MDKISQKEFEEVEKLIPEKVDAPVEVMTEEEITKSLEEMENPVKVQQRLAVQIKTSLDRRINLEMGDKGFLTENTRKWVESYNNILEKIQKALHGDKSVNLHLHKVTHGQIAAKMRKAIGDEDASTS